MNTVSPQPAAHRPGSFDHFAEAYDRVVTFERKHDFFLAHLPAQRRRVVDIGCGTGLLTHELSNYFAAVIGLDISEPMLAIAREKRAAANIEYRLADANQLALEGPVDLVVSHTTFHHLADITATLVIIKSALAPGGRLIVIDRFERRPWLPRRFLLVHVMTATAGFFPDVFRCGGKRAFEQLRFRLSRAWLEHLSFDRYLTAREFRETYGRLLPGAKIQQFGLFMGAMWESPSAERITPDQI